MDSLTSKLVSNLSISSGNEDSKNEDEEEILLTFTRAQFLILYYPRQNWSLPDSVIYYITNNPSNSKSYERIVQTCKYFFIKNSIIVAENLNFFPSDDQISVYCCHRRVYIDLKNFTNKIWVISRMNTFDSIPPPYCVSSFIPKLYRCEVKYLYLDKQILTFDEFLYISSNVVGIVFHDVIVKNDDGSDVPFEKLVRELSKIEQICYHNNEESTSITPNTVKELLKIPNFSNLEKLYLHGITQIFDIITFFNYIKKNKTTRILLSFDDVSEAYQNQLENCVDQILAAEDEFKCPLIGFPRISSEKLSKMETLFYW